MSVPALISGELSRRTGYTKTSLITKFLFYFIVIYFPFMIVVVIIIIDMFIKSEYVTLYVIVDGAVQSSPPMVLSHQCRSRLVHWRYSRDRTRETCYVYLLPPSWDRLEGIVRLVLQLVRLADHTPEVLVILACARSRKIARVGRPLVE